MRRIEECQLWLGSHCSAPRLSTLTRLERKLVRRHRGSPTPWVTESVREWGKSNLGTTTRDDGQRVEKVPLGHRDDFSYTVEPRVRGDEDEEVELLGIRETLRTKRTSRLLLLETNTETGFRRRVEGPYSVVRKDCGTYCPQTSQNKTSCLEPHRCLGGSPGNGLWFKGLLFLYKQMWELVWKLHT